ncbi:MAG: hypothetical protein ACUVWP_04955 [bacterium]
MKKYIVLFLFITLILPTLVLSMAQVKYGNVVEVNKGDIIEGDIFCFGAVVDIKGRVEGDITCFSAQLTINGEVDGDVKAFCALVEIFGKVNGDVQSQGAVVRIGGEIGGELKGNGASFLVSGLVKGDASLSGAVINAGGVFEKNLILVSDRITLYPDLYVVGDLGHSVEKITLPEGAIVNGKVYHYIPKEVKEKPEIVIAKTFMQKLFDWVKDVIWHTLAFFVIGFALLLFVPMRLNNIVETIKLRPLKTIGIGALILIVLPIASIILMITFIGIPTGLITLTIYTILLYTSQIIGAIFGGVLIMRLIKRTWDLNIIHCILIGIPIYALLKTVPILGRILFLASALIALGGISIVIWQMRKVKTELA